MACLALRSSKGMVREANEDACCAMASMSQLGEVVMAVVCDGVGGLSHGEVASATVINRFMEWFRDELPPLLRTMRADLDCRLIQTCWSDLLDELNERIALYGRSIGALLGTTFTGLLACGQSYVIGHVGDCRAYCLHESSLMQLTEDQTLLAFKLANGEITAKEAVDSHIRHVIMQSVGTERRLRPAFYVGTVDAADVLVVCSDGAYQSLGNTGLREELLGATGRGEHVLDDACREILSKSMRAGERDNLSIVCVSCDSTSASSVGGTRSLVSVGRDAL